ncbi:MAG: PAS domain S-box protein [Bacteroidetes bacterium]|nr:PAS domain S-box protein [Bacteroidota bacterium]
METLKILILEDNENDMDLLKAEVLSSLNYNSQFKWVVSKTEFLQQIREFHPDIILSDYNLPQFNGLEALQLLKEIDPNIPFIIVTGTLSEEAAADSIKAGAWDYVVKERLHRLPSAMDNALKMRSGILKMRKAELELKLIKEKTGIQIKLLYDAINHAPSSVVITDKKGTILYVNPKFEEVTGYKSEEAVGQNPRILKSGTHGEEFYKIMWTTILSGKEWKGELVNKKKNGLLYWEQVSISPIMDEDGKILHFVAIKHDITEQKEYEERILQSENWYKAIFGNTGTSTCILDKDGVIVLANSKFEELSGFSKTEIEGTRKWSDFVLPDDLEKMNRYHRERREAGKSAPKEYEFSFRDHSGNLKNILLTIDLIPGTQNSVASLLDITERKKTLEALSSSEEKFRLISTSAQDGIIMIDNKGEIIYWNPGAEKIFGFSFEEIQNKKLHPLLAPGKYHQQQKDAFSAFLKTGTGTVIDKITELEAIRKDGRVINIELSLAGMKLASGFGAVGIVRDITERKQAEAELVYAKEKAEESDRLKSAFLATMSHELRTPLNAVIGFSGLIAEDLPVSEIMEMAERIHYSGNHLLKIIESMFEISMLEARVTKPLIEEFSVFELFGTLKSSLIKELAKQSKEHISTAFLPQENASGILLRTDKIKLTLLMSNLLNNAVKFTDQGKIEYGFNIEGKDITFFVKDTGIGIPPDQTEVIFERFRQVDDTHTRRYGGIGLGLSICREISNLLQGELWVESVKNVGSAFYFKLPDAVIDVDEPNIKVKETGLYKDLSGTTILVVEDEEDNYFFLKTILNKAKAKTLYAHNGQEAIDFCREHPEIDLVLMDIKMPVMSGDEATKIIKKSRKDLPVIAQTAYATSPEVKKYMQIGFDAYITKPIIKDELLIIIREKI